MDYRASIDTLYIGLDIDDLEVKDFLKEIKNYLFFYRQIEKNSNYSRNRFYREEWINEENSFFMFLCPRKNVKNHQVTIQLGGKFFRCIDESKIFVNWLLGKFQNRVIFQRVDVALDCLYKAEEFIDVPVCSETNTKGFPFPSYSEEWRNRKIEFDMYCRVRDDFRYCNMVSQGKDDIRLRVYDKSLDLLEKYDISYHTYYELKQKYVAVYRIEMQLRGDKLKKFIEGVYDYNKHYDLEYQQLVIYILSYLFKKYKFEGVDYRRLMDDDFNVCFNHMKDETTIEGRIIHHKKMMNYEYKKLIDLYDELRFRKTMDKLPVGFLKDYIAYVDNPFSKCAETVLDFYAEQRKDKNTLKF